MTTIILIVDDLLSFVSSAGIHYTAGYSKLLVFILLVASMYITFTHNTYECNGTHLVVDQLKG